MIKVEAQNTLNDYMILGFDNNLNKLSDELYAGANKNTGVITSLNADAQLEAVSVNKLSKNEFKQTMTIGRIVLDGVKGSIEVHDKNNRIVAVIGKLPGV